MATPCKTELPPGPFTGPPAATLVWFPKSRIRPDLDLLLSMLLAIGHDRRESTAQRRMHPLLFLLQLRPPQEGFTASRRTARHPGTKRLRAHISRDSRRSRALRFSVWRRLPAASAQSSRVVFLTPPVLRPSSALLRRDWLTVLFAGSGLFSSTKQLITPDITHTYLIFKMCESIQYI